MKKVFFNILMITIIFAIVSGILYYESAFKIEGNETINHIAQRINEEIFGYNSKVDNTEEDIINNQDIISGVTNIAQIFIIFFVLVLIPYPGLMTIIFLQILARIFQIGIIKRWKNIISIILTIISLLIQLVVIICYMYVSTKVNMDISNISIILGINILYFVLVIMNLKRKIPDEKDLIQID